MPKTAKYIMAVVREALALRLGHSVEERDFLWTKGWKAWHEKYIGFNCNNEREGAVFPFTLPPNNWKGASWDSTDDFVGKRANNPLPGVAPPAPTAFAASAVGRFEEMRSSPPPPPPLLAVAGQGAHEEQLLVPSSAQPAAYTTASGRRSVVPQLLTVSFPPSQGEYMYDYDRETRGAKAKHGRPSR